MKKKHIFRYFTNLCILLLVSSVVYAQNDETTEQVKDSSGIKLKYGLRLGVDSGKILRSVLDDNYEGIELIGDFRISRKIYIAAEIGNEKRTIITDFLNTETEGSYIKAGIDYNLYDNWLDMDNMVFFGPRIGASTFSHTINEYQVYTTNQYWAPQNIITEPEETESLTAFWVEFIFGVKAELFTNFFIGINAQLKVNLTETEPDNFENIYIPGFNRTYDSTRIGVGYGYTLSYRIPLFKKAKKIKKVTEKENTSKAK